MLIKRDLYQPKADIWDTLEVCQIYGNYGKLNLKNRDCLRKLRVEVTA